MGMLVDIVAGAVLIFYSLVLFFTGYAVGRRVKDGNDKRRSESIFN